MDYAGKTLGSPPFLSQADEAATYRRVNTESSLDGAFNLVFMPLYNGLLPSMGGTCDWLQEIEYGRSGVTPLIIRLFLG